MPQHEKIEIATQLVRQTKAAICIENLHERDTWLPKSQIECDDNYASLSDGDKTIIHVPEWLAMREHLI